MNVKLKVLRKVLEEAIANIDAGNSNYSDYELDDIIRNGIISENRITQSIITGLLIWFAQRMCFSKTSF